ncbi:MAG: methyltransferase [Flavobacteriales bacterium]|nr:MAG: methyltransferase [Flavobacteriales bacterium]
MYYQTKAFIQFLLQSTNKHGIHSPFVYNLITKCFNTKIPKTIRHQLRVFKKGLLQNQNIITITDFGAGSKKLNSGKRKVSEIAKSAGMRYNRMFLLNQIIKYFDIKKALEIGTSVGISAAAMAIDNPNCNLITLEGCENTAAIAKNQFKKFNLTNITVKTGRFEITLPQVLKNQKFDLIFFDGNHQKTPTINYFEQCLPHIHNDSVFIFDDIYWSKGMTEAWHYIKNHPKTSVSIDTYQWGIIFFRKEQVKENFVVRI